MDRQPQPSARVSRIFDEPEQVQPLRYWHIPRAVVVESRAFADNPTTQYIIAKGYDGPRWRRLLRKPINYLAIGLILAIYIHYFIALAVADGRAIALGVHGADAKPPPNRAFTMLQTFIKYVARRIRTQEQQARSEELDTKMGDALKRVFGDKIHEYAFLQLLYTDPAAQGRGYGSALMHTFDDMVDDESRSAYLVSTNVRNTAFYNAAGFVTVDEWTLGERNPRWREKPVVVSIMVREATKPHTA